MSRQTPRTSDPSAFASASASAPAESSRSPADLAELRAAAWPLAGRERLVVPEPAVKAALVEHGVVVPAGRRTDDPARLGALAVELHGPLVLKAFGPGIVHKSEVGAVRVGLDPAHLDPAAREMAATLTGRGLAPAGYLVEEQVDGTVELLVGVVRHPSFGLLVVLGLGGVLAESLDAVVTCLGPLDEPAADELLDSFERAVLAPRSGIRVVDRAALRRALLGIAGHDGLAGQLGGAVAELECNPLLAGPAGVVAADARLVLDARAGPARPAEAPALDTAALFTPRTIAVAGASSTRATFGNRALEAYRAVGWDAGLVAVHPRDATVAGVAACPSLAAAPGGRVDYLLLAVPAEACVETVAAEGARAGVVQVVSGGFGETGDADRDLGDRLVAAARASGTRVVGPNCLGVYAPRGRQTFLLGAPTEPGPVGVVSQSGGLTGDLVTAGARRGLRFSTVVSAGNALDVGVGELVEALVADTDTTILGLYLEGPRDGRRLVEALRSVRGAKPVVILAGGREPAGAGAVASHTGALAGDEQLWAAVGAATGATVVRTLEELVGVLVFHHRYAGHAGPGDPEVLLLGVGGGASVLGADACGRAGLGLPHPPDALVDRLRTLGYGAGTSVLNPFEVGMGPAAPPDTFHRLLDAVLPDRPYPAVLLHVNVAAYYAYGTGGLTQLLDAVALLAYAAWATRLVLVARNLDVAPAADAERLHAAAVGAGLPLYRTFDEAAVAIAAGQRHERHRHARGAAGG